MRNPATVIPGRGASRSLAEKIRKQLLAGEYRPGDRLPPLRKLVDKFDLGYSTVNRAMEILAADGWVESRHGSGTFVRDRREQGAHLSLSVFALIVPEVRTGYYPALVKGFDDAAGELNHQMILSGTDNNFHKQGNVILQLMDKHVAGVALLPTDNGPPQTAQVRQLQRSGVPVVLLHRGVEGVSAPLIAMPYAETAVLAARSILQQGHRHVAYFDTHRSPVSEGVGASLQRALEEAGGALAFTHLGNYIHEDVTPEITEDVEAAVDKMFKLPGETRPTAIFSGWDPYTELIHRVLRTRGKRIPEDISLVSFGGAWRGGVTNQQFTAVTVDEAATGRLAAQLLADMSRGERAVDDNEQITVPVQLAAGKTLGVPPEGRIREDRK